MPQTDRIEKQVLLKAPRAKVWRTLTDVDQLGKLFHGALVGKVEPGAVLEGPVTHPAYPDAVHRWTIVDVVPERRLTWRWHPGAMDPKVDYSKEPTTLVEFTLEDAPEGTLLKLVESGFDALPAGRRLGAFEGNGKGWTQIMKSLGELHGAAS